VFFSLGRITACIDPCQQVMCGPRNFWFLVEQLLKFSFGIAKSAYFKKQVRVEQQRFRPYVLALEMRLDFSQSCLVASLSVEFLNR